jgi:hypothetical protein
MNCGICEVVGGCNIVFSISGCGQDDRGSILRTHTDFVYRVYGRTFCYVLSDSSCGATHSESHHAVRIIKNSCLVLLSLCIVAT